MRKGLDEIVVRDFEPSQPDYTKMAEETVDKQRDEKDRSPEILVRSLASVEWFRNGWIASESARLRLEQDLKIMRAAHQQALEDTQFEVKKAKEAEREKAIRECVPLMKFAEAVLDEHKNELTDLDGGWIQGKAIELGIFISVDVERDCDPPTEDGESQCRCAEYGFPTQCIRYSEQTRAILSRLTDTKEEG